MSQMGISKLQQILWVDLQGCISMSVANREKWLFPSIQDSWHYIWIVSPVLSLIGQ